jgi:hypothetical protein
MTKATAASKYTKSGHSINAFSILSVKTITSFYIIRVSESPALLYCQSFPMHKIDVCGFRIIQMLRIPFKKQKIGIKNLRSLSMCDSRRG